MYQFKKHLIAALGFTIMAFALALNAGSPAGGSARNQSPGGQPQSAAAKKPKGCFTCDFGLPGALPLGQVPALIERDRMYMAEQPGMRTKHLPLRIDFNTGNLLSGGRYLFDTFEEAQDYKDWITNGFVLDGVNFLQRPFFLAPECHTWRVIGARDFGPVKTPTARPIAGRRAATASAIRARTLRIARAIAGFRNNPEKGIANRALIEPTAGGARPASISAGLHHLHRHRRGYVRMRLIVGNLEIFKSIIED